MAKLREVVGALLTDLTRARVTSDGLTRHLSGLYRPGGPLAGLPIPRADLLEVELDLRFAVADLHPCERSPTGERDEPSPEAEGGPGLAVVDVVVGCEALGELPEASISSLKIRSTLRNHCWSEVVVSEGHGEEAPKDP